MKRSMLIAACATAALFAGVSCVGEKDDTVNRVKAGDPVPEFVAFAPDSTKGHDFASRADFGGRKSLLVLFDPTCGQCKIALRTIETVWNELIKDNQQDYCLVNISRQQTEKSAKLWEDEGFSMPYYLDPDRSIFNKFAEMTVPRIYLIGTGAVIDYMAVEEYEFTAQWLEDKLKALK